MVQKSKKKFIETQKIFGSKKFGNFFKNFFLIFFILLDLTNILN